MDDPLMKLLNLTHSAKLIRRDLIRQRKTSLVQLKQYITLKEIKGIIEQNCQKIDDHYFINYSSMMNIYKEVNNWIDGLMYAKYASEGKLDSYWDDETNSIKFKLKEKYNGKETI
jgi:hypothetical protein